MMSYDPIQPVPGADLLRAIVWASLFNLLYTGPMTNHSLHRLIYDILHFAGACVLIPLHGIVKPCSMAMWLPNCLLLLDLHSQCMLTPMKVNIYGQAIFKYSACSLSHILLHSYDNLF